MVAEAESGCVWNFTLYCGKDEERPQSVPLGTHVVLELSRNLCGMDTTYILTIFTQVLLVQTATQQRFWFLWHSQIEPKGHSDRVQKCCPKRDR